MRYEQQLASTLATEIRYKPHQIETAAKVAETLRNKGVCLLQGEMRTGKTRAAIKTAELLKIPSMLVVTTKNAIEGWQREVDAVGTQVEVTLINYDSVHKVPKRDWPLVVVDESHKIGRPGKPTNRFTRLKKHINKSAVLLMTGTPMAESPLALYYQFALSAYHPFPRCPTFYDFFRLWGLPSPIRINGRQIETYKRAQPALLSHIKPWVVTLTQEMAGITAQATDQVHVVPLDADTKLMLQHLKAFGQVEDPQAYFDTDMGARLALHQLEAGAFLVDGDIVMTPNTELVDYIKATFPQDGLGLMAHYRSTRAKLALELPHAHIFSSTAHAEGVDLSHLKTFVVVNTGFSGAQHVQRRDRIVNMNTSSRRVVHHLVTDGGISADVYDAVSKKRDFTLAAYRSLRL